MVDIAQWLERLFVAQKAVGSSPIIHPEKPSQLREGFLFPALSLADGDVSACAEAVRVSRFG
jgi:hypothetical protein